MKAFRSIRDEMRDTAAFISHPYDGSSAAPMRREPDEPDEEGLPAGIEPWMESAFELVTHASELGAPIVLAPCLMNGEPAAVICFAEQRGGRTHVRPLFVACQESMVFTAQARDRGGGGGGIAEAEELAP